MTIATPADQGTGPGVPPPRWLEPSLSMQEGRDPLGLQTTTQDRLMPLLLPGILELSRRARYFSFHAFVLSEYRRERAKVERNVLSAFIKRAEWDLGLAVQRCKRCDSGPVGARRLSGHAQGAGPFPRGESVESALGGYGLYYRSPLISFGIVAGAGTPLGGEPIPIDVLRDTARARGLADAFRDAVADTAYYRDRYLWTAQPLLAPVVDEYAAAACLCLLRERPRERDAVHAALFAADRAEAAAPPAESAGDADGASAVALAGGLGGDAGPVELPSADPSAAGTAQRRRSVAHYLTLLDRDPAVVTSESAYRQALWAPPAPRSAEHAVVAGQWSALAAKDVWQEALCSVWSQFCRAGLARTRALGRGLTWQEARELAGGMLDGPPALPAGALTGDLASAVADGRTRLPLGDQAVVASACTFEELRLSTRHADNAASGLVVLLELARRMSGRSGAGWDAGCRARSAWQPSLAAVKAELGLHLASRPAVPDTMWWAVSRFVVPVHERIAYSKLPTREFTFRFRWEDGLLRFYDHGIGRFPLAAIRNEPLASLTHDLGFWTDGGGSPSLTDRGRSFVAETLE